MQNSSKALLIAGAILVALLIISLGIAIFNSTSDLPDQVDSDAETVSTSVFNSQFTTYFSKSTSGAQAKSLVYKVMSNNLTSDHKIHLNLYSASGSLIYMHQKETSVLQKIHDRISNSSKYKIRISDGCRSYSNGYDNGYIACIAIVTLP